MPDGDSFGAARRSEARALDQARWLEPRSLSRARAGGPALTRSPYAVFDDWLSAADFARLGEHLRSFRYFSTDTIGKRGPLGTIDELRPNLAAGQLKLLGGQFVVHRVDPSVRTERELYPSGTGIDVVLSSVLARLKELEPWLGRERRDWQLLGAGPRLYPQGRGLALHDDARFVGTFTLYAHEEWRPEWDGFLELTNTSGAFATRVEPKPNRLVALAAGVPHLVRPVAEAAGERLRTSVIGYTYRPQRKVETSIEKR